MSNNLDLVVEVFGDALYQCLQEQEGMVIEYGDEWFLVYKDEGHIRLSDITESETFTNDDRIHGKRLWIHDEAEELAIMREAHKQTFH